MLDNRLLFPATCMVNNLPHWIGLYLLIPAGHSVTDAVFLPWPENDSKMEKKGISNTVNQGLRKT